MEDEDEFIASISDGCNMIFHGIVTSSPRMEAPPVTWDDMLKMYERMLPPPKPKHYIIGEATWDRMWAEANEEDRRLLEVMREREQIIVSPHMPRADHMWIVS